MFDKNKEIEKPDIESEETGRYKFYKNENATEKNPDLLSGNEAREIMDYVSNYEWVPLEIAEKDMQTPEFKEEIEKRKEWISEFGKKIGLLDLRNTIGSAKLYLISEEDYEKIDSKKYSGGCKYNEMVVKKKNEKKNPEIAQHELIHMACKNNIFLRKELKHHEFISISLGYGGNFGKQNFNLFNEGLTETTNQQIQFEDKELSPIVSYLRTVIFTTELTKNLTEKIKEKANEINQNGTEKEMEEFIKSIPAKLNGEKREATKKELENIVENLTSEEVLAHFQRGMFLGKRKYLKIVREIYGADALNALAKMENNKESIIETAKIFDSSLGDIVKNKIRSSNMTWKKTGIDIGEHKLPI